VLFGAPFAALARDWWSDPDAAHGLLLAPLALVIAWKRGVDEDAKPQPWLGCAILAGAVIARYLAGLAAEVFTLRISMLLAAAGLAVCAYGFRQILRWWLPAALLVLSVPLPDLILSAVAFPLQLKASSIGAALLSWRHVPVQLAGNVIHLPGQALFVTEACSGLRSLSALIALGLLMGGIWLQNPALRAMVVLLSVPVAILINGVRVFLTGYLVHFGNPSLGTGFMHMTEGWALFVAAFLILGGITALLVKMEEWTHLRRVTTRI
jgi:exosortase